MMISKSGAFSAGNPELKPASWKIGYKPIPGDGEPVFGELEKVPGCFVAFTHSGATLGLIAGELLAGEILTGSRHPMLETFRPERFVQPANNQPANTRSPNR
ncbi:glycine/D-amino acid oxidase-like deaminating enzyme [Pseudarthrobacter siccitolerans]|uniref:Glycine/D-amino acid oxidase-like deaminating enzyme n=1 Tax=Pseudarthrobacter siccitolerans TaxID=861266 RepID=A0ABU0PKR5_9MICC|nr:glycine/D-amino acid oxidase-like deaminating enzyme [Pseudarthrobacter siccitolerans]